MKRAWMNSQKTAEERAELLLAEMTLEEKCGQLCQRLTGFSIYEYEGEEVTLSEEFRREVEACQGLGLLYGLYRADPWSGRNFSNGLYGRRAVHACNAVQKYVMEHSRLQIPVLMSTECPHGHQALDGYLLPVNLASGASFDPELYEKATRVCGAQLHSLGAHLALVSMLDMLRDPRWGRSEECYGEDPYLSSVMAAAAVRGFHGADCKVVAKHFAAQGEGTGGVNASAARIGERELREIHLPAAKSAVEAGCDGIMAAYNEIDGIFCHANRKLLTGILRDEFGFKGIVMADGCAIDNLTSMTGNPTASGALALGAGVDVGLWDQAYSLLPQAVKEGLITEAEVDRAVKRVLIQKFEAGLFEQPFLIESGKTFTYENYEESLELARESVILLENKDGALPLAAFYGQAARPAQKIACIGPNADDIYRQLGDYTPEVRPESGCTVLAGMRRVFGADRVLYAEGSRLRSGSGERILQAVKTAEQADAVVLVLGGSSSRFEGVRYLKNGAAEVFGDIVMDCGEGVDLSDLSIPKAQMELFDAVETVTRRAGKKLITVVIAGRPMILGELGERSDALLLAFYPGPMGGLAIAEQVAGLVNPSGRLPASLPSANGQLPVYYNYRKSYQAFHYRDGNEKPSYVFGYGLDYSTYQISEISAKARISLEEVQQSGLDLSFTVEHTGGPEGTAVVLCYIEDVGGSVVTRVKNLKAFTRIRLKEGERKVVKLHLSPESFALVGPDYKSVIEPGVFRLFLEEKGKVLWEQEILCIGGK